ncbi:MAG TPA: prepilin peptidase [Candidatus Saccharimonadales bacterium]|nr:prepilin peptidase [Candidatus Saccharimonadales bacterium]
MVITILGLLLLGLCIGSFINALIYRLHWQGTHKKVDGAEKRAYSISSGRSVCPHCKHRLAAKDLIPFFSWIMLHGRCRYCNKPISGQYPTVELITAFLFALSYIFWPYGLSAAENIAAFVIWLVFLSGFIALFVYDLKYMILPNRIILPLAYLAGIGLLTESLLIGNLDPLVTAFWGILIGGGIFYVLFQVSDGAWIGGGDVKLGLLLGAVIGGPWPALLMLFLASLIGTLYSLPLIMSKKVKPRTRIPFGPFLITAAVLVQFFGMAIIDWYQNMYGV